MSPEVSTKPADPFPELRAAQRTAFRTDGGWRTITSTVELFDEDQSMGERLDNAEALYVEGIRDSMVPGGPSG